jgi:tetratricopeptide (TPR) repeat protein
MLHFTIQGLLFGWLIAVGFVIVAYLFHITYKTRSSSIKKNPWKIDEIIFLVLIIAGYFIIFPVFTSYKIDGDFYTFLTKVSDALAGKPMNITEPIFGTDLWPGVRSAINQLLPIWALWSYLSRLNPVDLTAYTSRSMFALWALLASYFLGKEALGGNRRFGLFTATIQLLIYISIPFIHSDNVSIFFLERTNADKFTVAVTMLPVVFGLAIYYVRTGQRWAWVSAAVASFTVSAIHPLTASMLALGLIAFAGFHWILNFRSRASLLRSFLTSMLAGVSMLLPFVLLLMSRGSVPLAPTYPKSFEGWTVGGELTPVLPFISVENIDWYGPLPDLSMLESSQANSDTNPFLIWRYAFNMRRQRLIVFDLHRYIVNPSLLIEPAYILALLLTPILFWKLRSNIGAQFVLSTTIAVLLLMFNPLITPIVGSIVVPWLLWRFVWLFPYALIISLGIYRLLEWSIGGLKRFKIEDVIVKNYRNYAPLLLVILIILVLAPSTLSSLRKIQYQDEGPRIFPTPNDLLSRLNEETLRTGPVMVAANQNLSVTIPVYAPNANIIGHRVFNTSEFFPADQQDLALQRLIDQYDLYHTSFLNKNTIEILERYNVRFIIASSGSGLDFQLRLSPQWFEWLVNDQSFSLYAVKEIPSITDSIKGNTAILDRDWETAERHFRTALEKNKDDLLALTGLVALHRTKGQGAIALNSLEKIESLIDSPLVHFRKGQILTEIGQIEKSIEEFELAVEGSPEVSRYHLSLGDACLRAGDYGCATREYQAAVDDISDNSTRLITLAELWRKRDEVEIALSLYEQAASYNPSVKHLFALVSVYQDLERYDKAQEILDALQKNAPLSTETLLRIAKLKMVQKEYEQAIDTYKRTSWLQEFKVVDSTRTHVALAQSLLQLGRIAEGGDVINQIIAAKPFSASAYILLGNLYSIQNKSEEAIAAYKEALEIDPTDVAAYNLIRQHYQQQAELEQNVELLQRGIEINPNEPSLFFSLGDQLQRLGKIETAIAAYQLTLEALDVRDTSPRFNQKLIERTKSLANTRLGMAFEDLGEVQTAMSYYYAAAASAPTDPRSQIILGNALRRRLDITNAETFYRKAIEIDPTYIDGYLKLAELFDSQGETDIAEFFIRLAVQMYSTKSNQPGNTIVHLSQEVVTGLPEFSQLSMGSSEESESASETVPSTSSETSLESLIQVLEADTSTASTQALARIYERAGQIDRAIDLYNSEIQVGIENNKTRTELARLNNGLGDLYASQQKFTQAIEAYTNAIELDGLLMTPKIGISRVYTALGNSETALDYVNSAVEISPGSVETQLALANELQQRGEWESALDIYEQVIQTRPGNNLANLAYAKTLQERNLWGEAEEVYISEIERNPGNVEAYIGLANLYGAQAKYSDAELIFTQALEVDYANAEIYTQLGGLLSRLGRYDEAINTLEKVFEFEPGNVSIHMALAQVYKSINQSEKAISLLENISALNPTTVEPLLTLASLYREQNQPAKAEGALLIALERSPGNATIRSSLAELYQLLGKSNEAIEQLKLSSEENPGSMKALVDYADELRRNGEFEKAQVYYDRAEEMELPSAMGYRALASMEEEIGHLEKALAFIEESIKLAPNDPVNWLFKADIQSKRGDTNASIASLREATQTAPNQGRVWHALGEAMFDSGQFEEALPILEQALKVEPTYLPTYGTLIQTYNSTDQSDRVEDVIASAKEFAPGSYLVDVYEARVLRDLLQWDESQSALERAIGKAPGLVEPYMALGRLFARLGKHDEAINTYEQALELEMSNSSALSELAEVYLSIGRPQKAINLLIEATKLYPSNVESLITLSEIYRTQNQPDYAEEVLLVALDRSPGNSMVRNKLAEFYTAIGQSDKAIEQYRLATIENPDSVMVLVRLANELGRRGEIIEAEAFYLLAEESNSPTTNGYRALAAASEAGGNYEAAQYWIDKAIDLAPNDPISWLQLAGLQNRAGDVDASLESLRQAIQIAPSQGRTWHTLGEALLKLGRVEEAVGILEKSLDVEPTYLPTYGTLIEAYSASELIETQDEIIAKAREMVPGSYLVDLYEARVFINQHQWDEAQAALQKSINKAPGKTSPHIALARLMSRHGQYDDAIKSYKQVLDLDISNSNALTEIAEVYQAIGRRDEAIDLLNETVKLYPTLIHPSIKLASLYREENQPGREVETLLLALERSHGNLDIRLALADLYKASAQSERSLHQYQLAVDENPDSMIALVRLAEELYQRGEHSEAEALYALAGEVDVVSSSGYRALASTHASQGRINDAQQLIEKSIHYAPSDPLNWLQKANLHDEADEQEEMMAALYKATKIAPNQGRTWHALGEALHELGKRGEAVIALEQSIAVEPTYLPTYGTLIEVFGEINDNNKVSETIEAARLMVPGSYLVDLYEARMWRDQKNWVEARSSLDRAISKAPGITKPYLDLGTVLARSGQYSSAISVYEQALRIEPLNKFAFRGMEAIYKDMDFSDDKVEGLLKAAYVTALLYNENLLQNSTNNFLLLDNLANNRYSLSMRPNCLSGFVIRTPFSSANLLLCIP